MLLVLVLLLLLLLFLWSLLVCILATSKTLASAAGALWSSLVAPRL